MRLLNILVFSSTLIGLSDTSFAELASRVIIGQTKAKIKNHLALSKVKVEATQSSQLIWVLSSPTALEWKKIDVALKEGKSIFFFSDIDLSESRMQKWGLRKRLSSEQITADRISIKNAKNAPSALEGVVWESAPQVGKRKFLDFDSSWKIWAEENKKEDPLAMIATHNAHRGKIIFLNLAIDDISNRDFRMWPYFNYLLYCLESAALEQNPQKYGDWESSPIPKKSALWLIGLFLIAAWLVTLWLFFRARRISRSKPEVVNDFFKHAIEIDQKESSGAWQHVGFARPFAGFLTLTGALFVLFVPYYYLNNILVPNDIQPFPQAKGMWDFAWETLQVFWFIFDAGTFVAFVKYFAEFRIKEPQEALRSAQFFVWWQILTGLVQVSFAILAAVVILPNTQYGYTSSFVILVALGQYPGFFGVITFFFQAYQRFDYNIGLDFLSEYLLRFLLMIPFVLWLRKWGAANPQYGEAFGAALGMGIGFYVASVATFGIGVILYRRMGFQLGPLFMAHFSRQTAKRMLVYGLKVVVGKALFRAAQAIDKIMIAILLFNYTEWIGLKGQIYTLLFLFPLAYRFFETSMAALSESHGNQKYTLTKYYLVRYMQVGSIYTAIGLSLLFALGPTFIREVMDPQWARAADYLLIAGLVMLFVAPAWLSDMLQKGADRPGLFAFVLGGEQALRILLALALVPIFQFWGYYWAILLTIIIKVSVGWLINYKQILKFKIYPWQMFIAPVLAGVVSFIFWFLILTALHPTGKFYTSVLFFGASLISFPLVFFLVGLFGGYDKAFFDEFDHATQMTGILKPLTRFFYWMGRLGIKLSPLHDRFPITIYQEAIDEAHQLEEAK